MQKFIDSFKTNKAFIKWLSPLLGLGEPNITAKLRRAKEKPTTEFNALVLGAKCLEQKINIDHLTPVTIKKEKDLFCLYQNDKKIMIFDSAERALEALGAEKGIYPPHKENELFL